MWIENLIFVMCRTVRVFSVAVLVTCLTACIWGVNVTDNNGREFHVDISDNGEVGRGQALDLSKLLLAGYYALDDGVKVDIDCISRGDDPVNIKSTELKDKSYSKVIYLSDLEYHCKGFYEFGSNEYFYKVVTRIDKTYLPVLSKKNLDCIAISGNSDPVDATRTCLDSDHRSGHENIGLNGAIMDVNILKVYVKHPRLQSWTLTVRPDRCPYEADYCAHDEMPLYNQGSKSLLDYVNLKTGYDIAWDPGWCVPTGFSMIEKTLANRMREITSSSFVGDVYKIQTNELIYATMRMMSTDIRGGITYEDDTRDGIDRFYGSAQGGTLYTPNHDYRFSYNISNSEEWDDRVLAGGGSIYLYPSTFSAKKPYVGYSLRGSTGSKKEGHFVVLHGTEADRYKIFDPWGRIYTVKRSGEYGEYFTLPSSYGYVKQVTDSSGSVQIHREYVGTLKKTFVATDD